MNIRQLFVWFMMLVILQDVQQYMGGARGVRPLFCSCIKPNGGRVLLHSEVVSSQTSIVDVENQASVISGGIKHLCLEYIYIVKS